VGRISKRLSVPDRFDGERVDKVVAALLGVSRAEARRCFDEGSVQRDGVTMRPAERVATADVLVVDAEERLDKVVAEAVDFGVLFEDEWLAVVAKPAGLVVHPGAGHRRGTLVGGLLERWPSIEGVGEDPRWGIVHRLDRETSGALLVAKVGEAHEALQRMIGDREVERHYRCLAHGLFPAPTGTIDAPIERDPVHPTRQRVAVSGRQAITHYSVAAAWSDRRLTYLDVKLETGRTHQIRVHLESIGHHVVGDPVYGKQAGSGIDPGRVWLHAARLVFTHPMTGQDVDVEAPLPDDLVASLEILGAPTSGEV
jgi:23S rRNA pseudouridine1911/1915/1917 synthase